MSLTLKKLSAESDEVWIADSTNPTLPQYLRVKNPNNWTDARRIIGAAARWCQGHTGRQFLTATWRLSLNEFPCGCESAIEIPLPPLQSAVITYIDTEGVTTTLAAEDYKVDTDSEPGRIVPAYGKVWPSTRCEVNAVQVSFVCGYGAAADVPADIWQAILMLAGHWWENRTAVEIGAAPAKLQLAVEDILNPYRMKKYR